MKRISTDITKVPIAVYSSQVAGIQKDGKVLVNGTVVATGDNKYKQCDVKNREDIMIP